LEFKTISMDDLWEWLPEKEKQTTTKPLSSVTDFWTGLEHFKFEDADAISIKNNKTSEVKSAGFEELMSAFYQYKKAKL